MRTDASTEKEHLDHAKEQESNYDWIGASRTYESLLRMIAQSELHRRAEIEEKLAYSLFKASFQAETNDAFRNQMTKAIESYTDAIELYSKAVETESRPKLLRCEAMASYAKYWIAATASEKSQLVARAWSLTKQSLDAFRELKLGLEFGRTYNALIETSALTMDYEADFGERKETLKEGLELGETAIKLLDDVGASHELALAYMKAAYMAKAFHYCVDVEEAERFEASSSKYWRKAVSLSEDVAPFGLTLSVMLAGQPTPVEPDEEPAVLKKALEHARRTGDRLVIGCVLDMVASEDGWLAFSIDDLDERETLAEKMLQSSVAARDELAVSSFVSPSWMKMSWSNAPDLGFHYFMCFTRTDLKEKAIHARKCLDELVKSNEIARNSGYPELLGAFEDGFADTLTVLAQVETSFEKKKEYLEQAIEHANARMRILGPLYPYSHWVKLGYFWGLAMIKFELSNAMVDEAEIKKTLLESIDVSREAVRCCDRIPAREMKEPTRNAIIGNYQYWHGTLLSRFFLLSKEKEYQLESAEAFEKSVGLFVKSDLPNRAAESWWKGAQVLDSINERKKSAERFLLAADCFKKAAKKIPQLEKFYLDHSSYMEAWSEIEKAMYHHGRQEAALARKCFENSAVSHESTEQWGYLSSNYSAWAQLEHAEDLSQKEMTRESIDAFNEALRLFGVSKRSMSEKLGKIERSDERQLVEGMIKAASHRQELCKARITLEEAKLLDKEGETGGAREKFGSAADMFTKIMKGLPTGQDQKEIDLIITLSKAWEAMAGAESEASPKLYAEASRLFDEAKELSPSERAKYLAMGHSRFCKALEAGMKFSDSGDISQHDVATDSLENAAKFYLKAGQDNASEYARASKLLFDAYVHMSKASKEQDHDKKAKLYSLAEKILQASASSYEKADQPGRKEQVTRLLAKVRQDKELAMSLTEVLRAPDVVSTTMAFSSPAPSHEAAVGLERFEHADIQATLVARPKDLNVGEDLSLEIELVNAGKGIAQLAKVEKIVPEGFEVSEVPEKYRIEDSYLNMKGRRLDALKTEDVKIILRPRKNGHFALKPRITYLDDVGKYRYFEPDSVEIVVKELGISGWLKGPDKR